MTSLVLLDYDAAGIKQPSRSAITAAAKLGEVHGLIGDLFNFLPEPQGCL